MTFLLEIQSIVPQEVYDPYFTAKTDLFLMQEQPHHDYAILD
jgi:hypothetical protein